MSIVPRTRVPDVHLPLAGGGRFVLSDNSPKLFTMLVFYRGLHCPVCKVYLRDLHRKLGEFAQYGVEVVAISTDSQRRAEQTKVDWGIEHLDVAYSLSIEQARNWGLFISNKYKASEPEQFSEPGLFLVQPDGTLYWSSIQTMPFARPPFAGVLEGLKVITTENYPARGEA